MKVVKTEVKTIYTILVEAEDVIKAFDKAKSEYKRYGEESYSIINGKAFISLLKKGDDLLASELHDYANRILEYLYGTEEDDSTLKFVIKFLEFDGIDHYGIYKSNLGLRQVTVYIDGSWIG